MTKQCTFDEFVSSTPGMAKTMLYANAKNALDVGRTVSICGRCANKMLADIRFITAFSIFDACQMCGDAGRLAMVRKVQS